MNTQDQALTDALATMATDVAAPVSTRRTVIERDAKPTVPASGYRVAVKGAPAYDVTATGFGDAVLAAMDEAKRDAVAHYGALIFMWRYDVTDAEGMTLKGSDPAMVTALQDARIEAQNNR